ncbi:MAG: PAS domain S-box protein [Methanocellales archaeon]|nr:PAS domain S-box protein [Methanocellales archaeon]
MAKNKDSNTNINQIDSFKQITEKSIIKRYKEIFSSYIENKDGESLYELSKLVRMCMDLNFGPEILIDLHFSTVKEFIENEEKKTPGLLKRLASYSLIHHELVKGLRKKVKEAEEALLQSEKRYRLLADNASDVIWTVDMNMNLTYASPSITRLLGYSVEESMINTMEEVFTPASYERAMKIVSEELEIENSEQKDISRSRVLEFDLRRKDGSIVPVEGHFRFLRDPNGQPAEILGMVRDITDRKRAEYAHKESEDKCYSLVNSIDSHVYLVDRDCKYLLVNNRYLSRLGLPRDQVIGRAYGEFHPKASTERFVGTVKEVFKTGKVIHLECISHRDGRQFLRTFSPVKDQKTGKIIAVTVISKDITENEQEDAF